MSEAIALGAVLTGGKGTRMGGEKAKTPFMGRPLVDHVISRIAPLVGEVVTVGAAVSEGIASIPDLYPGMDSLGGIATALEYAGKKFGRSALVLVAGCDMPFIEPGLIKGLSGRAAGRDIVVVRTEKGYEPLLALYRASAFGAAEGLIREGNLRISALFALADTLEVSQEEARAFDPDLLSFANANRPEDLERLKRAAFLVEECKRKKAT